MTTPSASTRELVQKYGALLNDPPAPVDRAELTEICRTLRIAARQASEDADVAVLRGLCGLVQRLTGGAEGALWEHETAARLAPDEAQHPMHAAGCLIACKRHDEALERLLTARALVGGERSMLAQICALEAEAHRGLGATALSRAASAEAARLTDPNDATALYRLAVHAAKVDRRDDALAFFARHVALAQKVDRGEAPALEFLIAAGDAVAAGLRASSDLKRCFEMAKCPPNWRALSPEEHAERLKKMLSRPMSLATTWFGEENPHLGGRYQRP